ncbi:allantoicase [Kribbella amoyensis]|uniref:Probable allantoicase n=1 Tax=Kribbella amoyensis TaxID=996641 RepID=A0A561B2P1_9ACTN|nr:allantoicase [Kribbella amoyensis]TWD73136.1 allantoicase [Kribbella amoyensis]
MSIDFTRWPDLASRDLAGSVVLANDELFAERENLIKPGPAVFWTEDYGPKGKVYDGWETRRRREPGHDHAVVRLGVPGVVRGVVIDTSWFKGNYPPAASVEATSLEGAPSPDELERARWETLVPESAISGDAENLFEITDPHRWTHVRLSIYPDGGVARFRVHGEPVPDPRFLDGTVDLAAVENGAAVVACSNEFYSSPTRLLQPGRAQTMADGWENARRRDDGNDHVTVRLAARGRVRRVELDTSYFVGNAPGWASLRGLDGAGGVPSGDDPRWFDLVPRTRLQPDTRHLFRSATAADATFVRLDVYPDGGMARLRVHGELADATLRASVLRWLDLLPADHAVQVLTADGGLAEADAVRLTEARPFTGTGVLPAELLARIVAR